MNVFQHASDDQLALIGCVVAILASCALLYASAYLGKFRQHRSDVMSPLRQSLPKPAVSAVSGRTSTAEERKAA